MSSHDYDPDDLKRRMKGALNNLQSEFAGLRTGRANVNLLDPVMVNAYGSSMPLNQVGTVSTPEPRMLTVQVWDKSLVGATEKAIREADLGLNPITDGQLLRIPLPEMNEERRKEIAKLAHRYAEQARVAIRNVRRDGMDQLKRMEKDGEIGKDEHHTYAEDVQALTDEWIKHVDEALEKKEAEIMQV